MLPVSGCGGNRIAQVLKVVLEKITVRGVASSTIAQQQDTAGICVALFANAIPVPMQAVGGELARIVTEADVDVTHIASNVIDAMRDQFSIGPTGEIVIEGL